MISKVASWYCCSFFFNSPTLKKRVKLRLLALQHSKLSRYWWKQSFKTQTLYERKYVAARCWYLIRLLLASSIPRFDEDEAKLRGDCGSSGDFDDISIKERRFKLTRCGQTCHDSELTQEAEGCFHVESRLAVSQHWFYWGCIALSEIHPSKSLWWFSRPSTRSFHAIRQKEWQLSNKRCPCFPGSWPCLEIITDVQLW